MKEKVIYKKCLVDFPIENHAVVLMNAHHGHFIIKNSWGYDNDVVPYGFDIPLQGKDLLLGIF